MYSKSTEGFPASGGAALIALAVATIAGIANPTAVGCGSFAALLLYGAGVGDKSSGEAGERSYAALVLGPVALMGLWCGLAGFLAGLICAMIILAWLRS